MSTPPEQLPPAVDSPNQKMIAGVAYGLYALSLFGLLLPCIAAIIVNYIKVDDSLPLYASHHRWMIRTFWWGLLWSAIGAVLLLVLVGWAVLVAAWVWWIYRLIRGFLALMEEKPVLPADINRVAAP